MALRHSNFRSYTSHWWWSLNFQHNLSCYYVFLILCGLLLWDWEAGNNREMVWNVDLISTIARLSVLNNVGTVPLGRWACFNSMLISFGGTCTSFIRIVAMDNSTWWSTKDGIPGQPENCYFNWLSELLTDNCLQYQAASRKDSFLSSCNLQFYKGLGLFRTGPKGNIPSVSDMRWAPIILVNECISLVD